MFIFHNKSTDPYFNLALEEVLLKDSSGEFILIWQNENTVVIGKNQILRQEVDVNFASINSTKIVRRLSGGGAVYHDNGNVNFSYIINSNNGLQFQKYSKEVCNYLETLGAKPEFSGRNDILLSGKKISGNAEYFSSGRMLHHGTLLFSSNLDFAAKILTPNKQKYQGKATQSVHSRICNICQHIPPLTKEDFIKGLYSFLQQKTNSEPYELSLAQLKAVKQLAISKYSTDQWNIKDEPKHSYSKTERFHFGTVSVYLTLENGSITSFNIKGDFFGELDISELCGSIIGLQYSETAIQNKLQSIEKYIFGMTKEQFLSLLF